MTSRGRVLLGRDVVVAGDVRVVDLGAVAAASTPGATVEVGPLRDANEDAAVVAWDAGRWVVAVVDGNGTAAGSEAVAAHVAAAVPGLLDAEEPDPVGVLGGAMRALHDARRDGAHATGASATLVVGDLARTWAASRGDTAALRVGPGGVRALSGVVPPPVVPVRVPAPVTTSLDAGEWVVLASDGLFAALGSAWSSCVSRSWSDAPARVARRLVDQALAAGAGDAVTVVVVAPGRAGGTRG